MSASLIDTRIFSNAYLARTSAAWQALLQDGDYPDHHVRNFIGKSWRRCVDQGLSHRLDQPPIVRSPGKGIAGLLHENKDFISATSEALDPLYDVIRKSDTVFIAADAKGTLLGCHGEKGITDFARRANVQIGSNWSEYSCGTNAIGTALAIQQAVQINGTEHFCEVIKQWTCSAALVRDRTDQSVIGVVDITGVTSESNLFYQHSLALVISIANHVETILAKRLVEQRAKLMQWGAENLERWKVAGAVLLDKKGREVTRYGASGDGWAGEGGDLGKVLEEAKLHLKNVASGQTSSIDDNDWYRSFEIDGEIVGGAVLVPRRYQALSVGRRPDGGGARAADRAEFDNVIRSSPVTEVAIQRARKLAASKASILIEGETGVGKEEFARAIHDGSLCRGGPYVALNCGAIAKDLISSELFGYVDGAFTGARRGGSIGKFELADGGTLFLDEIGELPLDVQAYLLRVLQDGSVTRLGASKSTTVKVRVLAATHRDLRDLIQKGLFREDLYYRLSVATLAIPPLRARPEDIAPLTAHFLAGFARDYQSGERTIDAEALGALAAHAWPGNVRELRNLLERVFLLGEGAVITRAQVEAELPGRGAADPIPRLAADAGMTGGGSLREVEELHIRSVVRRNQGNLKRASRELGISRSTLYEKLAKYGIKSQDTSSGDSPTH